MNASHKNHAASVNASLWGSAQPLGGRHGAAASMNSALAMALRQSSRSATCSSVFRVLQAALGASSDFGFQMQQTIFGGPSEFLQTAPILESSDCNEGSWGGGGGGGGFLRSPFLNTRSGGEPGVLQRVLELEEHMGLCLLNPSEREGLNSSTSCSSRSAPEVGAKPSRTTAYRLAPFTNAFSLSPLAARSLQNLTPAFETNFSSQGSLGSPRRHYSVQAETSSRKENKRKGKTLVALWGSGEFGRLGHGDHRTIAEPTICEALGEHSIRQVACGGAHSVVLTDKGRVFTMGLNERGQLGTGKEHSSLDVPMEVTGFESKIVHVAAGHHHTVCIGADGGIWAFGDNSSAQLGVGFTAFRMNDKRFWKPQRVAKSRLKKIRIVAASCGAEHTLALTDTGEVFSWGSRKNGRLGHGLQLHLPRNRLTGSEVQPRLIRDLKGKKVTQIAAGHMHSACVDESGVLFMWGSGWSWQLASGSKQDNATPMPARANFQTAGVACSGAHTAAVTNTGELFTWGANEEGCLGLGEELHAFSREPAKVEALNPYRIAQVACGWKHTAACTEDGRLFTWGWGGAMGADGEAEGSGGGQLGLGNNLDCPVPTLVNMGPLKDPTVRVVQVACGFRHTAALLVR